MATWQSDGTGIGRDLRLPEQQPDHRVWPFGDHETPGSAQLDDVLAGADYEKPAERPLVARSTRQRHPTGSAAPWVVNPPAASLVHRTGGSAQLRHAPAAAQDTVIDQLGAEHWAADLVPDDKAPVVCAHCFKPLQPAKHSGGGTDNKKYCSAAHRARASEQRKRQAAQLS